MNLASTMTDIAYHHRMKKSSSQNKSQRRGTNKQNAKITTWKLVKNTTEYQCTSILLNIVSEDLSTHYSKEVLDCLDWSLLLSEKVCNLSTDKIENLIDCLM